MSGHNSNARQRVVVPGRLYAILAHLKPTAAASVSIEPYFGSEGCHLLPGITPRSLPATLSTQDARCTDPGIRASGAGDKRLVSSSWPHAARGYVEGYGTHIRQDATVILLPSSGLPAGTPKHQVLKNRSRFDPEGLSSLSISVAQMDDLRNRKLNMRRRRQRAIPPCGALQFTPGGLKPRGPLGGF